MAGLRYRKYARRLRCCKGWKLAREKSAGVYRLIPGRGRRGSGESGKPNRQHVEVVLPNFPYPVRWNFEWKHRLPRNIQRLLQWRSTGRDARAYKCGTPEEMSGYPSAR